MNRITSTSSCQWNYHWCSWATFRVCFRVDSETAPQCFVFVCNMLLRCASYFTPMHHAFAVWRNNQPIPPPKWQSVSANQNCSFNCKWLPAVEASTFKAPICRHHAELYSIWNISESSPMYLVVGGQDRPTIGFCWPSAATLWHVNNPSLELRTTDAWRCATM